MQKKKHLKVVIVISVLAIALSIMAIGCTNSSAKAPEKKTNEPAEKVAFDALAAKTNDRNQYTEGVVREVDEAIAAAFPYEFFTFATEKYRDGLSYGHSMTQGKVEGPWYKGFGGQPILTESGLLQVSSVKWDKLTNTWTLVQPDDPKALNMSARCYACKSGSFNDLYEKYGSEIFGMKMTQEIMDEVNGQIWGCSSCHEDGNNPTTGATSQHIFFNTILGDDGDNLSDGTKVCAQCHNGTFFTYKCVDQEYFENARPWRYGFDADALIKAQVEDGDLGEAAGFWRGGGMHADFEIFQNSNHDSLGLDCVSCHMPQATAEDGTAYTDHDASQSPLENKNSLAQCLTCHKGQGIADEAAMVKMVREKQAEAGELETALREKLDVAEQAIANASTTMDADSLRALNEKLMYADFYVEYSIGSYAEPGIKIAHNPKGIMDYLARADVLLDEIIAAAK